MNIAYKIAVFTVIVSCLLLNGTPAHCQNSVLGPASFNQLNEQQRRSYIMAALAERDTQLQNFAYEITETRTNVFLTADRRELLQKDLYGVKRKGEKMLFHAKRFNTTTDKWDTVVTSWDGSTLRSLTYGSQRRAPYRGLIVDSESGNFKTRAYNYMLGLRMLEQRDISLYEWFQDACAADKPTEIEAVEQDGKVLIAFKVQNGYEYWKFYLDTTRDNMPVRAEYMYKHPNGDYNSESTVVKDAKSVDRFWVPVHVVRRTGTSAYPEAQTECVYDVNSFTRNTVTDDDFKIEFPSGTEVVDAIANVAYRVLPGGQAELLPLADAKTGKMIIPSDTTIDDALKEAYKNTLEKERLLAVENAVKANTQKTDSATQPPAETSESEEKTPGLSEVTQSHSWFWWAMLIAAILGGVCIWFAIKISSQQRKQG